MRKIPQIFVFAIALVLVGAASYAVAGTANTTTATVASVNTITACVNKKTHQMYDEARCPKGYAAVKWNVRGPAGAPGRNGTDGTNGVNGTNGTNGAAASIAVGSVATGAAGSNASVTNVGTSSAAKLNFTIPQGAKGDPGTNGTNGTNGSNGAAGATPWTAPTIMNNNTNSNVHACPYVASIGTTAGTPATSIDFNGSTYVFTGSTCKYVNTFVSGPADNQNTPDVDPSDWTEVAAAGANGTADAWAVIDPGVCAAGGSCTAPVLAHGGVAGSGVSFGYNSVGQYQLTITGCPSADTPAAGQPFPSDITVTPEGALPGESSHDASAIWVTPEIRDTTSLGVFSGLGAVHAYMYLGVADTTNAGQYDAVDEPFAVTLTC